MNILSTFTFLSPLYLIGALSALIPLVIHLSRSRRTKKMRFSTTRFFTDQFLRSYRMSRLREVFLLACRMALCALFAMALAQPLFMPKAGLIGGEGSRAVVLVVDNSASMGYTEDYTGPDGQVHRGTLLERAQQAATAVIDSMRSGDVASVVLAGRRVTGPEALFAQPIGDLNDVRQAVTGLTGSTLGTDLTAAVAQAEDMLRATHASSKEIYVFSDLQSTGFSERDKTAAAADASEVSYYVVRVQPQKALTNRAVVAVQYASARPMVGVPFAIRPLLNAVGEDDKPIEVSLFVDGEKVGQQKVEKLGNGRWAIPRFYHSFASPGWHHGYVEVQDQTLAADNRRFFALQVLDQVKVLAVNGAPSQVPRLDELFFLRLALTAAPEGQNSPVSLDTVGPAGLANADISKYPLVIVANVEQLPEGGVKKLEDFASEGGSVLFFLGDKINPIFYNETFTGANRRHGGLLPAKLSGRQGPPPEGKESPYIGGVDFSHPALANFHDPKFGQLLGPSVTFKDFWKLTPDEDSAAVLMKTSTGDPLLVEKTFGKGRVMVFASTCDRDWTNFPIRPAYLPFTHRVVAYLAQEPLSGQAFHTTGNAVSVTAATDPSASVLIKKPNGVVGSAVDSGDGTGELVFNDTAQAGIYTVLTPDQSGSAGLFAVNLDPYESNLAYLDEKLANDKELAAGLGLSDSASDHDRIEAGLKNELERPVVVYLDDPAQVATAAVTARKGYKLWDLVLLVVLAIGVFEPWLANRISARLYSRPRDVAAMTRAARSLPSLTRTPAAEATR
jgi:hypothetical protein